MGKSYVGATLFCPFSCSAVGVSSTIGERAVNKV